jgi:chemotaxis protein MotB
MAAADKKPTIVIKKITVVAGGGHGGSWKVAFADFMTAMMAFFLVMWLVGQSEEVKKSVADYFSSPSIIEYNFSNYGVELTLEKLFLDLLNEPLKAFEQFITPVDKKPNVMDMGTKKIQTSFLIAKIGDMAQNVQASSDEITFDIPEEYLFKSNTAIPAKDYAQIMERIRGVLEGLKDVDVYVNSEIPYSTDSLKATAKNTADARLDLILHKVEQSIQTENVDIFGKTSVEKTSSYNGKKDVRGYIKFRIRQKDFDSKQKVKSPEPSGVVYEEAPQKDEYDDFIKKLTEKAEGQKTNQ